MKETDFDKYVLATLFKGEISFKEHIESLLSNQVFSYSRLKLFEECPLKWFFKYVLKIEEENVLPLDLGKAVHKAIEMKMIGYDDKQALLEGWQEVDFYPLNLQEYEALYKRANVSKGDANRDNVHTELHFKLPLAEEEGSPIIQGFIDEHREIFGTYQFTDWKTNRVMYEAMDNMQLALYAWAISKIYNVSQVRGTLFFLRFFKGNIKSHTFEQSDMEQARNWAFANAELIREKLNDHFIVQKPLEDCFPAKANPNCSHCPFADMCVQMYPKIKESEGVFIN